MWTATTRFSRINGFFHILYNVQARQTRDVDPSMLPIMAPPLHFLCMMFVPQYTSGCISITASENVEEICRLFLRWVKYTMRVGGPETQGKLAKLFMDFVSVRYTYRIRRVWINKRYHKRYLKGNVLTVLPFCEVAEGLTDIELDFTRVSLNNLPGDFFPCIYSRLYR